MNGANYYQFEDLGGFYRIGSAEGMDQYRNPRTCAADGMTLDDMFKPGFAAVVIAEDWH